MRARETLGNGLRHGRAFRWWLNGVPCGVEERRVGTDPGKTVRHGVSGRPAGRRCSSPRRPSTMRRRGGLLAKPAPERETRRLRDAHGHPNLTQRSRHAGHGGDPALRVSFPSNSEGWTTGAADGDGRLFGERSVSPIVSPDAAVRLRRSLNSRQAAGNAPTGAVESPATVAGQGNSLARQASTGSK